MSNIKLFGNLSTKIQSDRKNQLMMKRINKNLADFFWLYIV